MRSDTAFFSAAVISRRFRPGLAPDSLSAAAEAEAATFLVEEDRREVERAAVAGAPRICSASVNVLISAWRRSISLCRAAIACAMSLMARESTGQPRGCQTLGGNAIPLNEGPFGYHCAAEALVQGGERPEWPATPMMRQ